MNDYPDDCIQCLTTEWWVKDDSKEIKRGSLVQTFVQYHSQIPHELAVERIDPNDHTKVQYQIRPLHAGGKTSAAPSLPVAALPRLDGADCFIFNRAKKRPCLILGGLDSATVENTLTKGMTKSSKATFFLAAPFFSTEQSGRSGYNPEFTERIRHAEYSTFFWDILPHSRGHESILRLDQIQPVGLHHQSFEPLGYRLSDEALLIIDEWLDWFIQNRPLGDITVFRDLMQA